MASSTQQKSLHRSRSSHHSSTSTRSNKTEIRINVYDLLPPGKLSTTLWHLGFPLLHTGLVITSLNHEYAFGGHSIPSQTGVYYIQPGREDPQIVTFRLSYFCGISHLPTRDLHAVIAEVSKGFLGPSYNLLTNNCNHFTSKLCEALTGERAPGWMNRAAGIGVCVPCFVPRGWMGVEEEEEEGEEERRGLVGKKKKNGEEVVGLRDKVLGGAELAVARRKEEGRVVRDEDGRVLPESETTPLLGMVR
ncbi:MAG: hypothetical protein LQ339_005211 [Xanthoria mediterranea]|nr:MAG: hypothetical protein LQ339_005211 [Xanthoria mediterranea]